MNTKIPTALAATVLALAASQGVATQLFFDETIVNGGLNMGVIELFNYGWGTGIWGVSDDGVCGENTPEENTYGVLTSIDANNGGVGASIHLDYPGGDFTPHGQLLPGNVIRFSCWLANDADFPLDRQDWQWAVLKIEFFDTDLGHPDNGQRIFDTDIDTGGTLVTRYNGGLLSDQEWRQFVFEYTYDPAHFDEARLQEVRPVVTHGDASGSNFNGNTILDRVIVEVFADQAAADANPVDATNPGCVPVAFVIQPFEFTSIGSATGTLVEFDSQLGVRYQLEYSSDGGSNWMATTLPVILGDGTRKKAWDPEGPDPTRIYQIDVAD